MNHVSVAELLADLAAVVPPLRGCACRGRAELFDRTISGAAPRAQLLQARHEALALCGSCDALPACRRWVAAIPADRRPAGVVAGQISSPRRERRPMMGDSRPTYGKACKAVLDGAVTAATIDQQVAGCSWCRRGDTRQCWHQAARTLLEHGLRP